MILTADKNILAAIAQLQRDGKLPHDLSQDQLTKLAQSLQKYSGEVGQRLVDVILEDFKSKIASAQSMTDPEQMRGILADLTRYVGSPELADQIKFSLHISQQVASGGGRYLNQNLSPEALDEYPALELKRMFGRTLPRGFKRGPKGSIIPVPDDAWPARWEAAGGELYDGRMIALKSDDVWQNLGDGDGDYDDTLGNPFPPFAFNSGFMTFEISRHDAVELGVMDEDDVAKPANIDFSKLFAEVAA